MNYCMNINNKPTQMSGFILVGLTDIEFRFNIFKIRDYSDNQINFLSLV